MRTLEGMKVEGQKNKTSHPLIHFTPEDWARIDRDWTAFMSGELKRPIVVIECDDPTAPPVPQWQKLFQKYPDTMSTDEILDIETAELSRKRWFGDAFPKRIINFGSCDMASYLGSRIHTDETTVWYEPIGKGIREIEIALDRSGLYRRVHEILDGTLARWGNTVQTAMSNIGGNFDILAGLRGTQELLLDLYDDPEAIASHLEKITALWRVLYTEEVRKIKAVCHGVAAWAPVWSRESCCMLQCDFSFMISPEMFDRYVRPDLEACCELVQDPFYHMDGSGQIPHLDILLGIKKLKGIQWIPDARTPPPDDWFGILRRIRAGGKLCQIWASANYARRIVAEIGGEGFIFATGAKTPEAAAATFSDLTGERR